MIGYQAQIIPALLVGFTLVMLERFFRKITPDVIQMIVVPFFAVVPTVILAVWRNLRILLLYSCYHRTASYDTGCGSAADC